jgi:outer membrane lipoprotein carrier protein
MKTVHCLTPALLCLCLLMGPFLSHAATDSGDTDALLKAIESRFTGKAFSAGFVQVTTDNAMGISDEAERTLHVKYPGKMRWVYDYPQRHFFITDGETVWIHKPDDNQVIVGKATEILGDSKGATFLSDIGLIRERFTVSLEPSPSPSMNRLKLIPKHATADITSVYLTVSKATGDVVEVTTTNAYDSETTIVFKAFEFKEGMSEDLFHLSIPEGADVLQYTP